jgi:glycerol uptake facilitator-like aquaporin
MDPADAPAPPLSSSSSGPSVMGQSHNSAPAAITADAVALLANKRPAAAAGHPTREGRSACCCQSPCEAAKGKLGRLLSAELFATWTMLIICLACAAEAQLSSVGPLACATPAAAGSNSNSAASSTLAVAVASGVGVFFGVAIALQASGAHLNPAFSVAFAVHGRASWPLVPLYIAAQFLGAFAAAAVVWGEYLAAMRNRAEDCCGGVEQMVNLSSPCSVDRLFVTGPQTFENDAEGFYDQVLGTMVLTVAVMAIVEATKPPPTPPPSAPMPSSSSSASSSSSTFSSPANARQAVPTAPPPPPPLAVLTTAACVGTTVMGIGLSLGYDTGYALNPARDLGPRVFLAVAGGFGADVFTDSHAFWWVPVVAPIAGALLGSTLYRLVFGFAETAATPLTKRRDGGDCGVGCNGDDDDDDEDDDDNDDEGARAMRERQRRRRLCCVWWRLPGVGASGRQQLLLSLV